MGVLDFLSKEAGQARRRALDERIAGVLDRVGYYAGPELSEFGRGLLQVGGMLNPVQDVGNAMAAGRDGRWGDMAVDVATVVAPVAAGKAAKAINPRLADDAAQWLEDALTGLSVNPTRAGLGDAAQRFAADESGVFAGVNALTADKSALNKAIDMTKAGASRDDIWRETGWFKGVDGKWRFEIDDSASRMSDRVAQRYENPDMVMGMRRIPAMETNLSGALNHDELFSAYNDMWNDVTIRDTASTGGAFYPDTHAISVKGPSESELRKAMLHELQHDIQAREGFAAGANPIQFMDADDPLDMYRRVAGEVEAYNVVNRADMTPAQRVEIPPWATQDTPDADQIFAEGAGKNAMIRSSLTPAEQQAQGVLDLLTSGRADEVTDEMLAAADDRYLFQNYDLPMDEASRMARAERYWPTDAYHVTDAEFQQFISSQVGRHGAGVYTGKNVADVQTFLPRDEVTKKYAEGSQVLPLRIPDDAQMASEMKWQDALPERWNYGDPRDVYDAISGYGDAADALSQSGFKGVIQPATDWDGRVIFNPANIRSRFARFDPRLARLRNLSAGVGGLGAMGLLSMQPDQGDLEQETRQYLGGLL